MEDEREHMIQEHMLSMVNEGVIMESIRQEHCDSDIRDILIFSNGDEVDIKDFMILIKEYRDRKEEVITLINNSNEHLQEDNYKYCEKIKELENTLQDAYFRCGYCKTFYKESSSDLDGYCSYCSKLAERMSLGNYGDIIIK